MTAKKPILLLTTGGTIASVPGGEGLEPRRSEVMERELESSLRHLLRYLRERRDLSGFLQHPAGGVAADRPARF